MTPVAIIGAGVMGRCMALALHRKGIDFHIFEKSGPKSIDSCTQYAAGMLSPWSEIDVTQMSITHMGSDSIAAWKGIQDQIGDIGYEQNGTHVLAFKQDLHLFEKLNKNILCHFPKQIKSKHLSFASKQVSHNMYIADEAHLDPPLFLDKSFTYLEDNFIIQNIKHVPEAMQHYTLVIDCRGLAAKNDFKKLRGVRGESLRVYAPQVNIKECLRIMHPRFPFYIVPKGNNEYILGASVIESEDTSPISVKTSLDLLSGAFHVHSDFAEARILKAHVGLRPCLPSHEPSIVKHKNCIRINGLNRHGFLLAPALACKVLQDYQDIFKPFMDKAA